MKKRIANVGFISVIVAFISVVAACSHAPNSPVDSASNNTVGLSQQAVAMPDSYSADAAMHSKKVVTQLMLLLRHSLSWLLLYLRRAT